jgi:TRAP-type C4-dicarboxylate transport system permease large subunit
LWVIFLGLGFILLINKSSLAYGFLGVSFGKVSVRNLFTSQRVPSLLAKLISRVYTSVSLYSNNSEFNNKIECSGLWKACMPRVLSFLLLFLLVTVHVANHGTVHSLKIFPFCNPLISTLFLNVLNPLTLSFAQLIL